MSQSQGNNVADVIVLSDISLEKSNVLVRERERDFDNYISWQTCVNTQQNCCVVEILINLAYMNSYGITSHLHANCFNSRFSQVRFHDCTHKCKDIAFVRYATLFLSAFTRTRLCFLLYE